MKMANKKENFETRQRSNRKKERRKEQEGTQRRRTRKKERLTQSFCFKDGQLLLLSFNGSDTKKKL